MLIFMSLVIAGPLCGQRLERHVIGSAGFATQNTSLQLSFTVGEPIAGGHQTPGLQLRHGFQQAILSTITGVDAPGDDWMITAYPNPLDAALYLEATAADAHTLSTEIFVLNGRSISATRPFEYDERSRQHIDVGHLAGVIYFVVFTTKEGRAVKTIKHLTYR